MSFLFPKVRKPRGFNYQPIYWDPEKERREEQIKKAKADLGMLSKEEYYSSSNLEGAFTSKKNRGGKGYNNSLAVGIILVLLGILLYFLFFI